MYNITRQGGKPSKREKHFSSGVLLTEQEARELNQLRGTINKGVILPKAVLIRMAIALDDVRINTNTEYGSDRNVYVAAKLTLAQIAKIDQLKDQATKDGINPSRGSVLRQMLAELINRHRID